MVHIKICGITTVEDAEAAAELGVEALGFNFWPPSPRYITPEIARRIIAALPPFMTAVGVFVDEPAESIRRIMGYCALDLVQLHGHERPDAAEAFLGRVIKAFRLKDRQELTGLGAWKVRALLIDAYQPGVPGGTGRLGDWKLAAAAKEFGRIILSGGLTANNIVSAINQVQPYGVDICSGVEIEPGRKDHEKLAALVKAVHNLDV